MSLGTVSASCLSPLGQISYEFVDIKQFNLCKYSSLLFPCSNLRSHSCITEVRDDVCMIVIDLLIDERFQHFSFLNSSVTFSSSSFYWSCYWMTMTHVSLFILCSALSSRVPICLCSSFILTLVTLVSFHFLIVTLLGLRLLKKTWF